MSGHYLYVEISVVGPGHNKIGESVIMQSPEPDEPTAQDTASNVRAELEQFGLAVKRNQAGGDKPERSAEELAAIEEDAKREMGDERYA